MITNLKAKADDKNKSKSEMITNQDRSTKPYDKNKTTETRN